MILMAKFDKLKVIGIKAFKLLFIILSLFASLYLLLGIYISNKHEEIVKDINKFAKEEFKGDITIGDVNILFFRHFPNFSVELNDVKVKDSLWKEHKKTLIDAQKVYVKINPWAVFFANISVNSIILEDTNIDFYSSENGYSNVSALDKRKRDTSKSKSGSIVDLKLNKIYLHRVRIISENNIKKKLFNFNTKYLAVDFDNNISGWKAKLDVDTKINNMDFSIKHGSFAKGKYVKGEIKAIYSKNNNEIVVNADRLKIGDTYFKVNAELGVSKENSKFGIHLNSNSIFWKDAAALVSKNISTKLYKFDFVKPFEVKCDIVGDFSKEGDPFIHVQTNFIDNELKLYGESIQNCNFKGEFTNDYAKNKLYSDPNSAILLNDFRGSYKTIPFVTKYLRILDLKKPKASGQVISNFEITKLNTVFNKEVVDFKKGLAAINVKFNGDIVDLKIIKPFILGKVEIKNSDLTLVKGNVDFYNNSVSFRFNTDRLVIDNISINSQNTNVKMDGYSENFMNLFYDNPEKIVLNWNILGKKLDLNNLMFLLNSNNSNTVSSNNSSMNKLIEKVLNQGTIYTNIKVDQIKYKKFIGVDAVGKISLKNKVVYLNEASIKNGKGSYLFKGFINNANNKKDFNVIADIENVDVKHLLYSFDNFGSGTFTSNAVNGIVFLNANINGKINDNFELNPNSIFGTVNFNLSKGSLENFKPLSNIGKYVFPNRNFNDIRFESINGNISLKNGIATLKPMEINTSVLNLDLGGNYGFNGGTNMQVDVHLRNPQKDQKELSHTLKNENRKKGIIIHLQAFEDKENKIKIKLRNNNEKLEVLNQ